MPFYCLVVSVVLLDQLTKSLILTRLTPGESVPVLEGVFHLTLVQNTGIAFGFLQRQESLLFVLITFSLLLLIYLAHRIYKRDLKVRLAEGSDSFPRPSPLIKWGMALILGGAIGNWIDRIRFHAVIDFLDFRVWPVFNLADSAITIGVCLYLMLLFRKT